MKLETRNDYYIELFDAICGVDGIDGWSEMSHRELVDEILGHDEHFYSDDLSEKEANAIADEIFIFARELEEHQDYHQCVELKYKNLNSIKF